jgi:hypothetical protein
MEEILKRRKGNINKSPQGAFCALYGDFAMQSHAWRARFLCKWVKSSAFCPKSRFCLPIRAPRWYNHLKEISLYKRSIAMKFSANSELRTLSLKGATVAMKVDNSKK